MFHFFSPNKTKNINSNAYAVNNYTLYDKFTTALAAGSVNATNAEPVGGARTVVDTGSKLSIANGLLTGAAGTSFTDPILSYPAITRALGKALLGAINMSNGGGTGAMAGWGATAGATPLQASLVFRNATLLRVSDGVGVLAVGTDLTLSTNYTIALVLRTLGAFYYIKGGTQYPTWTLLWVSLSGNTATLYVEASQGSATANFDNIRVPKRLYIPAPLQSDAMTAATTDGAGNAEANGPVGNAYTNVGTWGVAAGVRSCSVLSGADGKSYLACTSSNVIIDAVCTRSAGVTGIVARYVDANNYLIAYLDGTNAKLDKVVAGSTTNLISAAVTYGAAFVLRLILDDTSARLFYNNLAVGAVATTPAAGSLNHGLYTTDTGATFDNLIVWARGNEGQYSGLDAL